MMSDRERTSRSNISKQQQQYPYDAQFDHKLPRPPVPGEETTPCMSDWGMPPQMDWPKHKSSEHASRKYNPYYQNEPKSSSSENSSPPTCLRWAHSLHLLLQDSDGVKLFQGYLESEGQQHVDALDFWFACEGLRKQQSKEKIQQLVKVIYKKFFVKSALPISDELRKEIGKMIKSAKCLEPPVTLFDEAQAQVESLINKTTYPNFLKSDVYLQYLESVQNPSSGSSEFSSNEPMNVATGLDPLPTVYEESELMLRTSSVDSLNTGCQTPSMGGPLRLTKDLLLMSQKHRAYDVRPKSETFANMMYRGNGLHAAYNSYNPVSRQDSEMQSLSSHSDARTESGSSVDGRSMDRRRRAVSARQVQESAALNRETQMQQTVIPRTQRLDTTNCPPSDPQEFASILIEKLEKVRRKQETQELLDRKLKENEPALSSDDKVRMSDLQSRELANAIREKLQLEDDNDQDILDHHISRVFSDLTPSRSGITSPRQYSPPRNRHMQGYNMRPRRRAQDGVSTFSGDSGNVHDFAEGSEHMLAMVKSKSMPDYSEERFIRGGVTRRSSSKKTLTSLTDSGVSVVSDTTSTLQVKDTRVLAWLMESDRRSRGTSSQTQSEMSLKHKSHRTSSTTSPNASRHRKALGSRSNSLERNVGGSLVPHPFVADPNMPLLPPPNTTSQLEEARRRLIEDDARNRSRQRSSNRHYPDLTQSSQSTLRKSVRGPSRPSLPADEVTTVVFSFCEEQFPYRTKIPGSQITLRQFKEFLPKKGNYRFFFKTVCEELGNQVIQEEVSNDSDVLPLWEGKVMAQVKPID